MARKLDRLNATNSQGVAFQRLWQRNCEILEGNFTDIEGLITDLAAAVADIAAALAAAQAAQTAAAEAQADADAIAREAARLGSYTNPGNTLSATDAGADATLAIANHTRIYPVQGDIDVPDVSITGVASLTGLAYSTKYYVYYDDTTLAETTPTCVATTDAVAAQAGAAAGRHCLGYITTPASGGAGTSGSGTSTPGGTGGFGTGGAALP